MSNTTQDAKQSSLIKDHPYRKRQRHDIPSTWKGWRTKRRSFRSYTSQNEHSQFAEASRNETVHYLDEGILLFVQVIGARSMRPVVLWRPICTATRWNDYCENFPQKHYYTKTTGEEPKNGNAFTSIDKTT